jgi:nucleoid-associated protein YgaU
MDFPGASFFDSIDAVSKDEVERPDFALNNGKLSFTPLKRSPDYEKPVLDAQLELEFDAAKVIDEWESEVSTKLTDNGCSIQRVHSFQTSVSNGVMHGYFHVWYQARTCGWFFGDYAIDLGKRIETGVWQDFRLNLSPDNHVTLGITGHAEDNVTDLERGVGWLIGNSFALCPITGSLVLGWDTKVFGFLKMERDALEEVSKFRVVQVIKAGADDPAYTFPVTNARFDQDQAGKLLIHLVAVRKNLDETQACTLQENLTKQETQARNLPVPLDYVVKAGDSAWKIAEKIYGDGNYYWLFGGRNGLDETAVNQLRAGQKLKLESLGSVLRSDPQIIVARRDSFWAIAKDREPKSGLSYSSLIRANQKNIKDIDRIYPLQVLLAPAK